MNPVAENSVILEIGFLKHVLEFDMQALSNSPEVLPEIIGFTSSPVLFIVDGRRYAGHYHLNGLFYVAEDRKYAFPIHYARHAKTDVRRLVGSDLESVPFVSSCEYV